MVNRRYKDLTTPIDAPDPDDPRWITVDKFERTAEDQWCWILYKTRVTKAYYDTRLKMFLFCPMCTNAYMTECITGIIPDGPGNGRTDPTPEP